MNKLIVAAVATAVSGFVSVPAQSAPTSVTVVNTAAAPVPTTVQNVVEVDVLAGPPTRARTYSVGCAVNIGAYFCDAPKVVQAPPGMVMRVVGVSGVVNLNCQTESGGQVTLTGTFKPPGGVDTFNRIFVPGVVYKRTNATTTYLQFQGDAFFTSFTTVQFSLSGKQATCASTNGEATVHYVLEPLA